MEMTRVQSIRSTERGRGEAAFVGRRKLRTPDAAAYVCLAASTLNKLRVRGDGPVYSKLGRIVVYDVADLDGWLAVNKRVSTSDGAA